MAAILSREDELKAIILFKPVMATGIVIRLPTFSANLPEFQEKEHHQNNTKFSHCATWTIWKVRIHLANEICFFHHSQFEERQALFKTALKDMWKYVSIFCSDWRNERPFSSFMISLGLINPTSLFCAWLISCPEKLIVFARQPHRGHKRRKTHICIKIKSIQIRWSCFPQTELRSTVQCR